MESAIFGLIGVALGAILAVAREWWFQNRRNKKEAEYLSILVSCELERYAAHCADVVGDEGWPDEAGCSSAGVKAPKFEPQSVGVEWKSLPAGLMYEVLDFPYKAELAAQKVSAAFDYSATPPDYSEGFEERQLQYACLGLAALELATKLRNHVGIAPRDIGEWNPAEYMRRHKAEIELRRKARASKYEIERELVHS
ncbi:MAG: hypothetical protein ACK4S6_03175 [Roseateles asaccharophilus]|uniref:hypothetical protein n=1 Tax=Roseateles asaccharophilus TaxID=582607 RepID=UPI00391A909A